MTCNIEKPHRPVLLKAKLDNVKNISTVLKAINFKNSGVCFASECGWKIVVEDAKCVQANAFISKNIFQEYEISDDEDENAMFRIDLNTLVECLTIFDGYTSSGSTTAVKMSYEGYGHSLKMILEEDPLITDCSIRTMSDCDVLDFDMVDAEVICRVILRAIDFREVLGDLDSTSEYVEFYFSPDPPYFKITTNGLVGNFHFDIPKNSNMVESFSCTEKIAYKYRYSQIKPCLNSLKISSKISIRTNDSGLICLQFMIQTESKHNCYVEYYCTPIADD